MHHDTVEAILDAEYAPVKAVDLSGYLYMLRVAYAVALSHMGEVAEPPATPLFGFSTPHAQFADCVREHLARLRPWDIPEFARKDLGDDDLLIVIAAGCPSLHFVFRCVPFALATAAMLSSGKCSVEPMRIALPPPEIGIQVLRKMIGNRSDPR